MDRCLEPWGLTVIGPKIYRLGARRIKVTKVTSLKKYFFSFETVNDMGPKKPTDGKNILF